MVGDCLVHLSPGMTQATTHSNFLIKTDSADLSGRCVAQSCDMFASCTEADPHSIGVIDSINKSANPTRTSRTVSIMAESRVAAEMGRGNT